MSNKAIIEKTIEALESRGFSKAESIQIVRRIQNGDDKIPQNLTTVDKRELKLAYDRGFADGQRQQHEAFVRAQQNEAMRRATAQQRQAASKTYTGIFAGAGIFDI